MANGEYKMTQLDHDILRVCDTPKTSREVADELGANYRTVQWKVGQLKTLGLLEKSRRQTKDEKDHNYRYLRIEDAIPDNVNLKKEYQPLGMCIMGVWM